MQQHGGVVSTFLSATAWEIDLRIYTATARGRGLSISYATAGGGF
jgi:hypothetical protein